MDVIRPFNAEDNEINTAQLEILKGWAKKHNEVIETVSIYGASVEIKTASGRQVIVCKAEGCRSRHYNVRNYFYMNETTGGKSKRIKKEEW